jgi:hypothetical protein
MFINKLVDEVVEQNVTQAIVLVNNGTETKWFHQLAKVATVFCFPDHRLTFWNPVRPDSHAALQGQTFAYIGPNAEKFRVFCSFRGS